METIGRGIVLPDEIEDLKRSTLLLAKTSYVRFFSEILGFLIEKIESESDKYCRFYLSEIRTLIEIYAFLLFLSYQDENRQMAIRAANLLLTFSNSMKDSTIQHPNASAVYQQSYALYKPFLDRENIKLPNLPNDLSKAKLAALGLKIPPVEQMLKKDWIMESAAETIKVFPTVADQLYTTFRFVSNYLHGNDMTNIFNGHERFWLISKSQILSSILIELNNRKITNHSRRFEFDSWLKSVQAEAASFSMFWRVYKPSER
jgi:hypothetical protein